MWLEAGQIKRLVLVVKNSSTQEVLERWDFEVQNEEGFAPEDTERE